MRRTTLTIVVVVAGLLAVPVAGMAATGDVVAQTDNGTDDNATVAPGERLSGVVGVQEAELEGEVDRRAFGIQVARAATNDSKAAVVGEQLDRLEQRLSEVRERKAELDEARENGSMSEGEYRARVSELAAQTESAKTLLNDTNRTAGDLPADVLEAQGVNVSAIQTLKDSAEELTGPEVAAIARSIAGPNAGQAPVDVPELPDEADRGDNATDGDRDADSDRGTDTPTETPDGQDGRNGTTTDTETDTGTATDSGSTETDSDTRDGSDTGDSGY